MIRSGTSRAGWCASAWILTRSSTCSTWSTRSAGWAAMHAERRAQAGRTRRGSGWALARLAGQRSLHETATASGVASRSVGLVGLWALPRGRAEDRDAVFGRLLDEALRVRRLGRWGREAAGRRLLAQRFEERPEPARRDNREELRLGRDHAEGVLDLGRHEEIGRASCR